MTRATSASLASMFGIGHKWEKAEATVIKRVTSQGFNIQTTKDEWVIDVRPAQGEPFRAKVGELSPIHAKNFRFPDEGEVRSVLFDPKSRDVKWDRDDPRLFWHDDKDAKELDDVLKAPVGSKPR
jgi:hypothetical protein